jgi:hypothetical protein
MQCDRRRAEPHLRIFEALARLPQHLVGGDAQIVDGQLGMGAGHRIVDGVGRMVDGDRRIGQIDQEHAGARRILSSERAMTMPTPAPSAPVMKHFLPFTTQWLPSRRVVIIIEGSAPAPCSLLARS